MIAYWGFSRMQERRRFIRFEVDLCGHIECAGSVQINPRVRWMDFSREGIRIIIPQPEYSLDTPSRVKLYLPNRILPIVIHGEVRWKRQDADGVDVGLKILAMDSADKSEVLDYTYGLWRQKKTAPNYVFPVI